MLFALPFTLFAAVSSTTLGQTQAVELQPSVRPLDHSEPAEPRAPRTMTARLSDDVPLPVAATTQATDAGDVVVAHSSGDPFFTSFVAGRYYPPTAESIDPDLMSALQSSYTDARPTDATYAFVMFSKRVTPERIAQLEQLGCRVLGFHPHYCLKIALPPENVDQVAALDFVRWVGAPKSWQKVHSRLMADVETLPQGELMNVYIDVYDSDLSTATTYDRTGAPEVRDAGNVLEPSPQDDRSGEVCHSNGWQQRALERLGVDVLEYVDRIRAFRARLAPQALEALVARDFVLFVEPDLPNDPAHDESMPMVLADYTRKDFDGNDSLIAIAGQIDSGFDLAHNALNHVNTVGWDTTSEGSAILDNCEHGSHVAGTILALPVAGMEGLTGMAPGLGSSVTTRFRNVKIFDGACASSSTSLSTMFSHMRSNFTDANGNVSPKPHAINNSWGTPATIGNPWFGSEADPRTIDAEVWDNSQLYVFAAGNEGSTVGNQSILQEATAKNAFTVASVVDFHETSGDPGKLAPSSSIGPCGDGRWKPNIAAPGRMIRSVDANSGSGFVDKSGTSMAAPHVTGLAAQLCDHYSYLRYQPQSIASLVMATAMTDNGQAVTTPSSNSSNHLNRFGAGRINAANAHWIFSPVTAHTVWDDTLGSGWIGFDDFTVDPNCTRMVVVFTYNEDQCSSGAVPALVNDWDLYIDSPTNGIDPNFDTGEFTAQQSSIDNTEIRTISNPISGTWRWKVFPTNTTSSMRYSVTVMQIYGDLTPAMSLNVTANHTYVQPNQDVQITASVTSPDYYSSCVFLDSTSSGDTLQASTTTLADGAITDLTTNQTFGRDVVLGTLRIGATDSAKWTTRWITEGVKTWTVEARSDNAVDDTDAVNITVDGTNPGAPGNVHSTSHTANVWSNDPTIDFAWTAATDSLSGVDGYGILLDVSPTQPGAIKDIENVTSYTAAVGDGGWRLNLRTVDNAGNWENTFAFSPTYYVDTTNPTGPTGLTSPTHQMGVLSCNETMTVTWNAASDALSGLDGYVAIINTNPTFDPTGPVVIPATDTSHTENIGSSTSDRYLHLRAKDKAGNYGTTRHLGPIKIQSNQVSTYCTGKVNSLGCTPSMGSANAPSKSGNNFTVLCINAINQKNGIIFWGTNQLAVPFQGGTLCVAPPTVRTPVASSGGSATGSDCTGQYSFTFDTAYMNAFGMDPGETFYVQTWMRDPASAFHTGLSNGLEFTVCQ